ncbi:MAG: hypothetical protein ABFD07_11570 [Methanobacterium sp.]|jgi:hypothetical protein
MKRNWDDKSNNEILLELKQMQLDYEAQKLKTLKEFDKLIEIENEYNNAQKIIKSRLTGNK